MLEGEKGVLTKPDCPQSSRLQGTEAVYFTHQYLAALQNPANGGPLRLVAAVTPGV